MVNVKTRRDVETRHCEVAVVVSKKDDPSDTPPLVRMVEPLIQLTLVSEGGVANPASKAKIAVPFLESVKLEKVCVASTHVRRPSYL